MYTSNHVIRHLIKHLCIRIIKISILNVRLAHSWYRILKPVGSYTG